MVTGRNTSLSVHLLMEQYRRTNYWAKTHIDASYCLDAPDVLAAGSTVRDELDDTGLWIDMPSMVLRTAPER